MGQQTVLISQPSESPNGCGFMDVFAGKATVQVTPHSTSAVTAVLVRDLSATQIAIILTTPLLMGRLRFDDDLAFGCELDRFV